MVESSINEIFLDSYVKLAEGISKIITLLMKLEIIHKLSSFHHLMILSVSLSSYVKLQRKGELVSIQVQGDVP